jgi:hypothetical protein
VFFILRPPIVDSSKPNHPLGEALLPDCLVDLGVVLLADAVTNSGDVLWLGGEGTEE